MTVNNKYKEFVKKLDEKSNSNSDNYDLTETLDSLCKKIENRFKAISHEYNEEPVSNVKINNNIIKKKKVTINTSINNITDIIKLINTHPDDENIEYNIDIKTLHAIKGPLITLNDMIGMKTLKNNIVEQIIYFLQKFHYKTSGEFMHTVISGPPGTGKTEVAKIMGKLFSKIGVLKKGTFRKVTRSDLIAGYLGQTAIKTTEAIKDALGGVLFIDEAYALGNSEKRDSFAKECIDTLCEALSDHKDNLMVIIAGYENELNNCFFNYNQGLESRFVWRFKTDNYDAEDLLCIFKKKIEDIKWNIHPDCKLTKEWFVKNMKHFTFFGRDIETFLSKVKIAHSNRVFCKPIEEKKLITMDDIEKGLKTYLDHKVNNDKHEINKYLQNTLYC
jgi:SpoVK/Ycf46/Vps4 family AAA+-type ATPase